jgi:uncharacterized protein YabE (DUF348 family)
LIPLLKNIRRYFSVKEAVVVLLAVVISVSAGVGVFFHLRKEVVINDDGRQMVVKTMNTTVDEVLKQNGISISPDDYINVPLDTKLKKFESNIVNIKRAVPVSVLVDGQEIKLMTYRETVRDALENSTIELSEDDRLEGAKLDDKIIKDMNIKIVRVDEEIVTEKIPIPYDVVTRENNHMDKGQEKVTREGKEGIQEKTYKVVLEDGKEIVRELVKDAVMLAPVTKIVEFGTVLSHKTARGGTIRYSKVLDATATAYTASFKDTGKHPGDPGFGITYTGIKAKKGVIAVDPKVIPLGTKVYVEVAGSTPDYGFAVAADTGGAIKGNKIDLYFDDQDFVDRWGRKRVKVYILKDQN